jgi:tRNA uridine 5-carbamoylmethylation protein Kti12|tara:strand:- start:205 stop:786 length:582 start_codon:yes stop_codon:yes gene_type:complete
MKKPKIVLIDGLPTSGKSTTSYNLARKLPGWIFMDIWRIKDIFEPLGYSTDLDKKEADDLMEISKEFTIRLAKEVIRKTQRNLILQETTTKFAKKKLGKDLKKYNYQIFTVQLKVPMKQAIKRNIKRKKPTLNFLQGWDEERWENKIKKKTKKGDIVVDTFENNQEEVVKIILKAIGEKARKHPYEKLVRKFW